MSKRLRFLVDANVPQNLPPKVTARIVCSYVEAHTDELPNALVILSPGGARVRRA